jgi:hypothetical protein
MRRYGTVTVERVCLNCDEPFTPAATGWQALYCSLACWRANNGGPGTSVNPPPLPLAEVHQEITVSPQRPRLFVVAREPCPACGIDHDIYALTEEAT